jgi:hypothetical protein
LEAFAAALANARRFRQHDRGFSASCADIGRCCCRIG